MKKSILIFCAVLFVTLSASAQLANTKWKGMPNIPDPFEAIFEFKKDTLLLIVENDMVVETMTYELRGDTLVLTKLDGKSPCELKSVGYFKMTRQTDSFTLASLRDDCPDRAAAFIGSPWVRQKE